MQMAVNESFAFLFWKTFEIFLKNNCQKICTIHFFVVPLHSIFALVRQRSGLAVKRSVSEAV